MSKTSDVQRRYDHLARAYNILTLDRVVYGRARQRAIDRLQLSEGDTVLDIGCGTGLSLRGLREAVGETGTVIGMDLSVEMLKQDSTAHRRPRLDQRPAVASGRIQPCSRPTTGRCRPIRTVPVRDGEPPRRPSVSSSGAACRFTSRGHGRWDSASTPNAVRHCPTTRLGSGVQVTQRTDTQTF